MLLCSQLSQFYTYFAYFKVTLKNLLALCPGGGLHATSVILLFQNVINFRVIVNIKWNLPSFH